MGCTRRAFVLTICGLQIATTIIRQIFDFLGFMWAPIIANFFHFCFVIFGIFGAAQYRPKYTIVYSIWCIFWLGWNLFVICFYLDLGILDKDSDILNLGTGSVSWFEVNGPNCKAQYGPKLSFVDPYRPVRPIQVTDCLLPYFYIEVIQAAVQVTGAFLGALGGCLLSRVYLEEDDSSQSKLNGGTIKRPTTITAGSTPLYTIEFRDEAALPQTSPKPMTPRRVKRRSVNSRGSDFKRSTMRHSAGVNPVPYLDQTSMTPDVGGQTNLSYQQSSLQSLHYQDEDLCRPPSAHSSYSNYHGARPISYQPPSYQPQIPASTPHNQQASGQVAAASSFGPTSYRRSNNNLHQQQRRSAFLNNGPPAYLDSETVI